jgi:hypothetical protein
LRLEAFDEESAGEQVGVLEGVPTTPGEGDGVSTDALDGQVLDPVVHGDGGGGGDEVEMEVEMEMEVKVEAKVKVKVEVEVEEEEEVAEGRKRDG